MRKLALLAPVALVAFLAVLAPQTSAAADFPALADGGSLVTTNDAGFAVTVTTLVPSKGGRGVVRCPTGVNYAICEASASNCTPTAANLYLAPEVTYDIETPGGHSQFGIKTFDGGIPQCNVYYRRDRGE